MTDIPPEQLSALAALGRSRVLPRMKMTRETQFARQAFETYLDYLDWLGTNPSKEDVDPKLKNVARALDGLSGAEQDGHLGGLATYVHMLMEETSEEASFVALQTAFWFVFAIAWGIIPSQPR